MPRNKLQYFCGECFGTHDAGFSVSLAEELDGSRNICEVWDRHDFPPQLGLMIDNYYTCPVCHTRTLVKDHEQIFVVRVTRRADSKKHHSKVNAG